MSATTIINVIEQNPDKKAINELYFAVKDDGITLKVPALSKHWISPSRIHAKYKPLPLVYGDSGRISDSAELDEWLAEAEWFNSEMLWLLQLEHFRFWSNMVYDPDCIASVISFLQEALPFYTPLTNLTANEHVIHMYSEILQNVLTVVCRLVTNKESETDWITKECLAEYLYKNYLISIPMIFDILIGYGRSNLAILTRILQTLFKIEPNYRSDLLAALNYLQNSFHLIEKKFIENDASTSFDDLAVFTLDCAATIGILLDVHPDTSEMCLEIKLEQNITSFYDVTLPRLYKQIYIINPFSNSLNLLSQSRVELLSAFRSITNFYLEQILSNPSDNLLAAENFLAILQEALSDHNFIIDYQRTYNVMNDIDILKQACKDLDMFKVDYIIKAYTNENEEFYEACLATKNQQNDFDDYDDDDDEESGARALPPITAEMKNVLDVFPHLQKEFVRKLLLRYETTDLAITAILEGNLPPDLEETDVTPSTSSAADTKANDLSELLDDLKFNEKEKASVIIKSGKGFPGQPRNLRALLDDKSHVRELKTRFHAYGYVAETDDEEDADYNDEYDDSYDALADTESKTLKNNSMSAAKNMVMDEVDDDEDEEEEEENIGTEGSYRDRTKDFCENPETVRERYARNRMNKYSARVSNAPKPAAAAAVVGKPKGQGQDNSTLQSRHKKDVQKSTRANHNRRVGAAFKRNRGMIPS